MQRICQRKFLTIKLDFFHIRLNLKFDSVSFFTEPKVCLALIQASFSNKFRQRLIITTSYCSYEPLIPSDLKMISLIYFMVSEINILTKFRYTICYTFIINCTSFEKMPGFSINVQ